MDQNREISQRDLRSRSRAIMDAVAGGESFTVTRDGQAIGRLVPMPRKQVYVRATDFLSNFASAPRVDADTFRADIDNASAPFADDPYARRG